MTMREFKEITQAMEELTKKEPSLPEEVAWNIFLTMVATVSQPDHFITFAPQPLEN